MDNLDSWLKLVFNYGFPAVLGLFLIVSAVKGIRAIWARFTPWVDTVVDGHAKLMKTLMENDTKHAQSMSALASDGRSAHEATHKKLNDVHEDVRYIRDKVETKK